MSQSRWGISFDRSAVAQGHPRFSPQSHFRDLGSRRHNPYLLELLSGIGKLPGISADTLSEEHKAILLVVIGYRRKGGVSRTRIGEILGLEAAPYLEELWKNELVYTAPGKELDWWRPTPQALLALGLRSYTDVPDPDHARRTATACYYLSLRNLNP
jgi:hypothetical protein